MGYVTDRKRAEGLGSANRGTTHHWNMTVSSLGLLVLVPLFIFTFGPMLGESHARVTAFFGRPFPAIVAALTLTVGFLHFRGGVQVMIDDYVTGLARKIAIAAMICISYAAAATGLFAIARLAL